MAYQRMLGVGFCCVASFAPGQQARQSDSGVVFRANAKLVEISVIAEVKQGDDKPAKPVTDLRQEDFQVFDNGVRQEIRLFLAPTETVAEPEARPANGFTNRVVRSRTPHSGYSAIVFDNLLTDFGDPFAAPLWTKKALDSESKKYCRRSPPFRRAKELRSMLWGGSCK